MVKLSGESKVSFTIYLEYKIYLNFPIARICLLFTNQPVKIHIYLIEMLVFTYIILMDTHTVGKGKELDKQAAWL